MPWILKLQGISFAELARNSPLPVPATATATQPAKSEGNWWGWFIAFSIVSALIRGIASNNHSSPSSNNFNPAIDRQLTPEIRRGLEEIFSGKSKSESRDNEDLLRKYLRRKYESGLKSASEESEGVDEQPADALMPDQAPSDE
jgi:hypothetical protein